jgi:type I restriction enzyme, S subunit
MVYSIIKKSQLEGVLRIDAEYYQPEYLEVAKRLKDSKTLNSYIYDIKNGFDFRDFTDEGDVYYLRTGDFDDDGFYLEKTVKVDSAKAKNKKICLNDGDLLFTRKGNWGKVDIVKNDIIKSSIISSEIMQIRTKNDVLNPYYLLIFLKSKYGFLQIERNIHGVSNFSITQESLSNLKIFLIENQEIIEKICIDADSQKNNSLKLYQQAEDLLLEELKLSNSDNRKSFVVNFSEIEEAERIDAEYFQPKYFELIKHIKENCNGVKLGDLVTIKKGFEPGAEEYKEEGKLFIRVSSLSRNEINLAEEKYLSEKLYEELKNDYQPKKGEILLTKDATPGIAYVVKDDIEGIISGGILRLKLKNKDVEDEYLTLCLNSIVGQMQAERDAGGSVIAHWKPEQIKNVIIPILLKDKQQKITSLIRESFAARVKAKELLEEAKKKVEEMIERGGDK